MFPFILGRNETWNECLISLSVRSVVQCWVTLLSTLCLHFRRLLVPLTGNVRRTLIPYRLDLGLLTYPLLDLFTHRSPDTLFNRTQLSCHIRFCISTSTSDPSPRWSPRCCSKQPGRKCPRCFPKTTGQFLWNLK